MTVMFKMFYSVIYPFDTIFITKKLSLHELDLVLIEVQKEPPLNSVGNALIPRFEKALQGSDGRAQRLVLLAVQFHGYNFSR